MKSKRDYHPVNVWGNLEDMLIEVTNRCNHSCVFCYNSKMNPILGSINVDFAKRILKEAFEMGVRSVGFYTTGEMFLCKDIAIHIANAKKLGFNYIYSDTNGVLANRKNLESIITAGIDSIKFSINAGTKETYKVVHGSDDFERVMENLKICYELKKELNPQLKVFISYVVIKQNEQEIETLRGITKPYVDDFWCFSFWPHHQLRYNCDMNSLTPSIGVREFPMPCQNLKRVIVTFDGYLTACCLDFNHDLLLADLKTTSLRDAWNSKNANMLRQLHIDNKLEGTLCNTCAKMKYEPYSPLKI
jgi:MoaA/NifB/PqqE/SkfB family radical SAM enzyme